MIMLLFVLGVAPSAAQSVFVVPIATGDPATQALPAVAAAAAAAEGKPLVVVVNPEMPWRPELVAWIQRLEKPQLVWVGSGAPRSGPMGRSLTRIGGSTDEAVALGLAERSWKSSQEVVLCRFDERGAAFVAASLAGRLRVPLLPLGKQGLSKAVRARMEQLGVKRCLVVGSGPTRTIEGFQIRQLDGAHAAVAELRRRRLPAHLVALVSAHAERGPHSREHGFAAVLLAVGREGMVLPWAEATRWKEAVKLEDKPRAHHRGLDEGDTPLKAGRLKHKGRERDFLLGRDRRGRGWMRWVSAAHSEANAARDSEAATVALRTGDSVEVDGRRMTITLDASEKKRGEELRLTSPTAEEVREQLQAFGKAAGGLPRALVIVGWPQSFPMAILADGQGMDADLVSDLPYAQLDEDPFVDLAFTRLAAEDLPAASLIVARGFSLEHMPEQAWASRFGTAGWKVFAVDALCAAGLDASGHYAGPPALPASSPLTEVGLFVHRGHSNWLGMGKCYPWDSDVLLAPCVVESSGCSAMALDLDQPRRSVAARLLRNGALAYAGNMRRSTARQQLFRTEFRNALLRGESLGEAQRSALNRMIVAALDTGELTRGLRFYQLACAAVFGDPLLIPPFPKSSAAQRKAWPQLKTIGKGVKIRWPTAVQPVSFRPLEEWGCKHEQLTTWWGPMLGTDAVWTGAGKHDLEELWFTAEVRTKCKLVGVRQLSGDTKALPWKGRAYVDEHCDGSRSILWRMRMLDADMVSGTLRAERREAHFELLSR